MTLAVKMGQKRVEMYQAKMDEAELGFVWSSI
jgi:hypothetical protein